jgi:type IV secretory pathway VirB2 component (pilin)
MKKILKNLPLAGKYLIAFLGCFAVLSSFLVLPMAVRADIGTKYLGKVTTDLPGQGNPDAIWTYIGNIINIVLGVLGVILVVLVIYAGFLWMTSQGDKDKVTKAKGIITQAVIGLVIIFAAYALANFVLSALNETVTG